MKIATQFVAAMMAACLIVSGAAAKHKAAASPAPVAPACVAGADETALEVRVVQTDLMVAALSCGATARYNDFVKANQATLMSAHTQLGKFFAGKRGGEKALNAFITKLANDSSMRSIANIAQFCQENGWLYDAVLSPQHVEFATYVSRLASAQHHGFTPCSVPATYVVLSAQGPVEVAAATVIEVPAVATNATPAATVPSNPPPAATKGKPAKAKGDKLAER